MGRWCWLGVVLVLVLGVCFFAVWVAVIFFVFAGLVLTVEWGLGLGVVIYCVFFFFGYYWVWLLCVLVVVIVVCVVGGGLVLFGLCCGGLAGWLFGVGFCGCGLLVVFFVLFGVDLIFLYG